MALVRYEPWRGMNQLQEEINRVFHNWSSEDSSGATAGWVPAVDINEYGDRFELFVDLPGVDPKAVDITLDAGVLMISGERTAAAQNEQVIERRVERGRGRFHRRFILPDTVDSDGVKATDSNGVLQISIPKQAKAQPRRIQVAA